MAGPLRRIHGANASVFHSSATVRTEIPTSRKTKTAAAADRYGIHHSRAVTETIQSKLKTNTHENHPAQDSKSKRAHPGEDSPTFPHSGQANQTGAASLSG